MKIVLASTSPVKIDACKAAFGTAAGIDLVTVKAPSGVNEQPMNDETLRGAFNRLAHARAAVPGADFYVSIENGIFEEKGRYIDRAVVTVMDKSGTTATTYSDGVEFPRDSVEETRRRGFDQWTVGKVMQEQGIVRQHDDPHLDLGGKSRVSHINETMAKAVLNLRP
jgi:inosine/xanthosine triphosphatase